MWAIISLLTFLNSRYKTDISPEKNDSILDNHFDVVVAPSNIIIAAAMSAWRCLEYEILQLDFLFPSSCLRLDEMVTIGCRNILCHYASITCSSPFKPC